MKVFLGGTCNNSTWRDKIIPLLEEKGIEYFNPVVENWTEECQLREIEERKNCDFCLYVITPKMMGVYSIAEVIDDSNKRPDKTIFCFLTEDTEHFNFNGQQEKSLTQVGKMVQQNGGAWFSRLETIVTYLDEKNKGRLYLYKKYEMGLL